MRVFAAGGESDHYDPDGWEWRDEDVDARIDQEEREEAEVGRAIAALGIADPGPPAGNAAERAAHEAVAAVDDAGRFCEAAGVDCADELAGAKKAAEALLLRIASALESRR